MSSVTFLILAGISVLGALGVVGFRNPVYSVLSLIVSFFAISGIYLVLNAPFLAIVNIIVYAGAIVVLFLFVIMLLNLNKDMEPRKPWPFWIAGILGGFGLLAVLLFAAAQATSVPISNTVAGSIRSISRLLFNEFAIPFEVSSILFLTAIVGVILISRRDASESDSR